MMQSLPSTWRKVKLGICLQRRKDTVMPATLIEPEVGFVGLEDIEDGGRGGIRVRPTNPQEIDSLKSKFFSGDILYGKLRPYLNKVGIAPGTGICSTEIWAFEPSPLIDSKFAVYILASPFFVDRVASLTKGANLPRLDVQTFDSIEIPLPPLSEQKQIASILQEAEVIRNLRTSAHNKYTELIPSIFHTYFGEIRDNTKSWPLVPVSSFVEAFKGGKSLTGIEGDFDTTRPRVLKVSAVTSGFLASCESKALPLEYDPPIEHFVKEGDLLISRANTEELVGATALVENGCPTNLALPDKIWRFIWKDDFEGTPEFVWALFQEKSTRNTLSRIASGTGGSMKNISMKKLMQMRVLWPPAKLQKSFSEALSEVLQLCDSSIGEKAYQKLQLSLFANAFSGKLTTEWREANQKQLANEAQIRDAALREAGAVFAKRQRDISEEIEELLQNRTNGIYAELNREQRELLLEIERVYGGVSYGRYFTSEQLAADIDGPLHRHPKRIESHLILFAARGLVIPVSRLRTDTSEPEYAASYRLPITKAQENDPDEKSIDDIRSELMATQRRLAAG